MARTIREKFEDGVLVERVVEGSDTTLWHWLMLLLLAVIATAVMIIAFVAIHDSMAIGNALLQEDTAAPACGQPGLRS
jgi:hypothetical protein